MLVLFETPAGFALFKVLDEGKLDKVEVLKDGLQAVHVPYAYGFAIILLTILVKGATFPLTQKQVDIIESRGGQMTAVGKHRRTARGILWNILKSREPEAYKEIMLKGKEFEKQLEKENVRLRITDVGGHPNNKRNRTGSNDSDLGGQPNNKRNRIDSNGSSEKIGDRAKRCTFINHSKFTKDQQPDVSLLENTCQDPSVKAWVNGVKTNTASCENGCRIDANVQENKHLQKAKLPVKGRIRLLVGYDDLISDGIQDHDFKEENGGHIQDAI